MSTEEKIKELEEALSSSSLSKQEYLRVQAVLLKHRGYKRKEIALIVGKSFNALEEWITKYNKQGLDGLRTRHPKNPNSARLTYAQKDKIKEIINKFKPKDYGFLRDFWDIPTLKRLVQSEFGVEYKGISSYRRLFDYCGFSYQKVQFVDKRQNKEELDTFKKKYRMRSKTGTITMSW